MRSLFLALSLLVSSTAFAQPSYTFKWDVASKFPKPLGWVSDFEKILSPASINTLEKMIIHHEKKMGNEIAIVTVDSIGSYPDFFEYSVSLFNSWSIGKQDEDNGVLILFSSKMKRVRIATGLLLETKLTDDFCKDVIDKMMVPLFKKNEFAEGLQKALEKIIRQLEK